MCNNSLINNRELTAKINREFSYLTPELAKVAESKLFESDADGSRLQIIRIEYADHFEQNLEDPNIIKAFEEKLPDYLAQYICQEEEESVYDSGHEDIHWEVTHDDYITTYKLVESNYHPVYDPRNDKLTHCPGIFCNVEFHLTDMTLFIIISSYGY